jgi:Ferritin-like domain
VVTGSPGQGTRSRRELIVGAAAGGGAILVAGCGSHSLRSRVKKGAKVAPGDVDVLNRLLAVEYYAVAAYTAGIPFLTRPERKAAKQFLGQDVSHASTLAGLVKQAGGDAIKPQASYDLGRPRREDILGLLRKLEAQQLDAYIRSIPALTHGKLRSTAATMMANDAQHLAVLRQELGQPPVPSPFAGGRE